MNRIGRGRWVAAAVSALCCLSGHCIQAQDLRGSRIDLHPVKDQIGVVTSVKDKVVWIKLPHRAAIGQTVAFLFYSDGGDTMAVGKIAWAAPVAPYEAYVTTVHAVCTRHSVDPYDTLDAFEVYTKRTRRYGARPTSDGSGVTLAMGLFARTAVAPAPDGKEAVEPVRANIAALRAIKPASRIASAIADAAARALPGGTEQSGRPGGEYGVDYSALADNLEPFQKLRIEDTVVDRLLRRLLDLAVQNNGLSASVPADFVRAPGDVIGGQYGGTGVRR